MRKQFSLIALILTLFTLYAYGQDIEGKRTKNSVTYQIDKDKYQTIVSTEPMNYYDSATGKFKKVNKTVKDTTDVDGEKFVDTGYYKAIWKANKPFNYAFKAKGKLVKFKAQFDSTNLTVKHEVLAEGIKQTIILLNASAPTTLSWRLTTDAVMELSDNRINFKSGNEYLFSIAAPIAWDNGRIFVPVSVTLNGDILSYSYIPAGYEYPITIDPTTLMYAVSTQHTQYQSDNITYLTARNNTTATSGGSGNLVVGQWLSGGTYYIYRSYLMFATSSLPDNATLTSATLCLGILNNDQDVTGFNVHLLKGTMNAPFATTWFNDFTGWASSGTYSVTNLMTPVASSTWAANDSVKFTLNAAGLTAISLTDTTKYAVLSSRDITPTEPTGQERHVFLDAGQYLQVTYTTGWSGKINGVLAPAKINGKAVADIKAVNGVQ